MAHVLLAVLGVFIGSHETQVVHDDQIDRLFEHDALQPAAHLRGGQGGGIVHDKGGFGKPVHTVPDSDPAFFLHAPHADGLHGNTGLERQKAQTYLLGWHFQREEHHVFLSDAGGVVGDGDSEGRLAHRRAGADDAVILGVKAGQHSVKVVVSGWNAGNFALQTAPFLDFVIGGLDHLLDWNGVIFGFFSGTDGEKDRFRVLQDGGGVLRLSVAAGDQLAGRMDDPAEDGFFLHDLHISAEVGRGGNEADAFQQVGGAADGVQRPGNGEDTAHGHQIDGLSRFGELAYGGVYLPMLRGVEVLRFQLFGDLADGGSVLQTGADNGAFRVDGGRRSLHGIGFLRIGHGAASWIIRFPNFQTLPGAIPGIPDREEA